MSRKFIDCRNYPSESGCTVAISAQHATKVHGHSDTPDLRQQLRQMVKEGAPAA